MLPEPSFNSAAYTYDQDFTHTLIGRLQRERVRHFLQSYITSSTPLNILEINCGTGEDALWLASLGHHVTATDASAAMIKVAKQKPVPVKTSGSVKWIRAGFDELISQLPDDRFDLIFSNFSGLNCMDAASMKELNKHFASLLHRSGKLITVLFGKECWLEGMLDYHRGASVSRRASTQIIPVSEGRAQQTFYYSANELAEIFTHFTLIEKKPVGLFTPPSYMETRMKPIYLPVLRILESLCSQDSQLADYGDHIFIAFERR